MNRSSILAAMLAALLAASSLSAPGAQKASPASSAAPPGEVTQLARDARAALDRGQTDAAVQAYEKLVRLAPAVADYHLNLGIAYYTSERPDQAVPALRQALKLQPGLAPARHYLEASLAETGHCEEALPGIRKDAAHILDTDLKRTVEADGLKCAMSLDQEDAALDLLRMLRRDFPKDPEVLYLTVHVYSDLSMRASQRLLNTAPKSYQVHELYAEALEEQQKWPEAEEEYRRVLEIDPQLAGIHYRIGRLLLSQPRTPATVEKAKTEFEAELKIDPRNAGAEYVLGELNRQARNFPEAIAHFTRATQLDPTLVDAFIGLGKSLVAAGRVADAIRPLEAAVKLQPANPVAHYQLSFAYRRSGRIQDADRELAAYRQANDNARQYVQDVRTALIGQAQTAEPPE